MQFLRKNPNSKILHQKLAYFAVADRKELRKKLLEEQKGFCAYSERFVQQTDRCDIEHFYPKSEYPEKEDDYFNLYAVLSWINEHKPKKIKPYLPILAPDSVDIANRIKYENGLFICTKKDDEKAKNLIEFLGLNKPELYNDRQNHVLRIKSLKDFCREDTVMFLQILQSDKLNLSFITALETELAISFSDLL